MSDVLLGHGLGRKPVSLSGDEGKTHVHVIGSSGSGKSKFLEHLMRQDLAERRSFCLIDPHGALYESVLAYAAHHVIDNIVLLNLSEPSPVVGFNPFQRAGAGDVSVQVDRRISATMHAWNVKDTDATPTLARTLRLVYTAMVECGISLPQAGHLIDFNAREVRAHVVEQLADSPFVQREWKELQALKSRDWRDEVLSAKNRLCKFLTSDVLCRFLGAPGKSINLTEAMDRGTTILVNLASSDYLSSDNARAFGALLVNEFFECARRRKGVTARGGPLPYRLYLDEFQNFVSLDIADMLDQVRKFGLFMVLAHQRFGQIDENLADAVLTNCRIKAVFGGLRTESAKLMAQELFIGKLDPKKIKECIYQTKFWPQYARDKAYSRSTSRSRTTTTGTSRGEGTSTAAGLVTGSTSGVSFTVPDGWSPTSPSVTTSGESHSSSSVTGSSSSWSESFSESESTAEGESVTDIPIFIPVPFQELSSVQYYTIEEQIWELTAALKEQFPRHCFVKVHGNETQPLLIPFVAEFATSPENRRWYERWLYRNRRAIPPEKVDQLIKEQEAALLQAAEQRVEPTPEAPRKKRRTVDFFDTIVASKDQTDPSAK